MGPQPVCHWAYKRTHSGARLIVKIYLQATPSNSFAGSTPKQKELYNFILHQFMAWLKVPHLFPMTTGYQNNFPISHSLPAYAAADSF